MLFISWDCIEGENMKCHSQTVVGDDIGWNFIIKGCHWLAIGHVKRSESFCPLAEEGASLTTCWSWHEVWWDLFARMKCNVTHKLLAKGWYIIRLLSTQNCHCSHTVGHENVMRWWLDCLRGRDNITHILFCDSIMCLEFAARSTAISHSLVDHLCIRPPGQMFF